jgi:DNA repair exonuclease SbcCD ATPase subunit
MMEEKDILKKVTEWLATKVESDDDMYYVGLIVGEFSVANYQKAEIERLRELCDKWENSYGELKDKLLPKVDELLKKRKKILANRVYSDATLKGWKKEDLIEQIRILEHNWAAAEEALNNSAKNSEKLLAEQKAEIERLTEDRDEWEKSCHLWSGANKSNHLKFTKTLEKLCEERNKNAELQKQVDELTEQLKKLKLAHTSLCEECADYCPRVPQAVKNTAKEIFAYIRSIEEHGLPTSCVGEWVKTRLKERYGVEVE